MHAVTLYNAAYVARLESDRRDMMSVLRLVEDGVLARDDARRVLVECAEPLPDKFNPRKDEQ